MAGLGQAFGGLWVGRVLSLMPDWAPGSLSGRVVVNQRNKPEHTYSERRRGPEEMMNGDWKHWRRQVEKKKGSRGQPKLRFSLDHTHPVLEHKESTLLECPARTGGLGRGKGS